MSLRYSAVCPCGAEVEISVDTEVTTWNNRLSEWTTAHHKHMVFAMTERERSTAPVLELSNHPCDINRDKGGIRTHNVEMRNKIKRFYTCVRCGEAVIVDGEAEKV